MKNIMRLFKSMVGIKGEKSKKADQNVREFVQTGKIAKIRVDHMTKVKKTQTYYIAKAVNYRMGVTQ